MVMFMRFYNENMIKLEKVLERDIDLYIINKFVNDSKFKNLFLKMIGKDGFSIIECIHSYSDENGESDITIILENSSEKIGLLIEDKINAIAMPNQYERYIIRGEKLIKDGLFDKYYIFIIAPKLYLDNNTESSKYDYKISYEQLYEYIEDDIFGKTLLAEAINEKKKGYSVIENVPVTKFWGRYYNLIENRYPSLRINQYEGARGKNARWPIFITPIDKIQIFHKSNKGFVDLVFPGVSKYYYEVFDIVSDYLKDNMALEKTGKSLVIRINVPIVDFSKDFDGQIDDIIACLDAVNELTNLIRDIDCYSILQLRNKKS